MAKDKAKPVPDEAAKQARHRKAFIKGLSGGLVWVVLASLVVAYIVWILGGPARFMPYLEQLSVKVFPAEIAEEITTVPNQLLPESEVTLAEATVTEPTPLVEVPATQAELAEHLNLVRHQLVDLQQQLLSKQQPVSTGAPEVIQVEKHVIDITFAQALADLARLQQTGGATQLVFSELATAAPEKYQGLITATQQQLGPHLLTIQDLVLALPDEIPTTPAEEGRSKKVWWQNLIAIQKMSSGNDVAGVEREQAATSLVNRLARVTDQAELPANLSPLWQTYQRQQQALAAFWQAVSIAVEEE